MNCIYPALSQEYKAYARGKGWGLIVHLTEMLVLI